MKYLPQTSIAVQIQHKKLSLAKSSVLVDYFICALETDLGVCDFSVCLCCVCSFSVSAEGAGGVSSEETKTL